LKKSKACLHAVRWQENRSVVALVKLALNLLICSPVGGCFVAAADDTLDVLSHLPDDDDDDIAHGKDKFTVVCSQCPFLPLYYLQLDLNPK